MISPFIAISNGFAQVIQDIVNNFTLSVGDSSFGVVTIEIEIDHDSGRFDTGLSPKTAKRSIKERYPLCKGRTLIGQIENGDNV